MRSLCPRCPASSPKSGPASGSVIRIGSFYRKSDRRSIQRFRCRSCKKTFSTATQDPRFSQKKRHLNDPLFLLLCSGVSMRRAARLLGIHPVTVARKLVFLGRMARQDQDRFLREWVSSPQLRLMQVQFDEMESFEHTQCKPLSIALAVEGKSRKLLGVEVSVMPAKGPLARVARQRYGYRPDERRDGLERLFERVGPLVFPGVELRSDECPRYPVVVRRHLPQAKHLRFKGGRGCIVGQGELKKLRFDPIFSLNHTAAMIRANVNRLFRKTWCTTKRRDRLLDHLSLYVSYHNRTLTA